MENCIFLCGDYCSKNESSSKQFTKKFDKFTDGKFDVGTLIKS